MRTGQECRSVLERKPKLPTVDGCLLHSVAQNPEDAASREGVLFHVDRARAIGIGPVELGNVDVGVGLVSRAQVEHEAERPPDPDPLDLKAFEFR